MYEGNAQYIYGKCETLRLIPGAMEKWAAIMLFKEVNPCPNIRHPYPNVRIT